MEDLEGKISEILADPDRMAQVFSIAKSLGLTPPADEEAGPERTAESFAPMMELVKQASRVDPRETSLLNALKPYCSKERQARIDRALRAARLSRIAGAALRSFGEKE